MLALHPVSGLPEVLLVPAPEPGCDRARARHRATPSARAPLAISIGTAEASAMAAKLDGIELERPTTHELMASLLQAAGVKVERIAIDLAQAGHLQARMHLMLASGERMSCDSRPSDALVLALHTGAEIRVATCVMAEMAHGMLDNQAPEHDPAPEGLLDGLLYVDPGWQPDHIVSHVGDLGEGDLSDVSDEAFGKWKM